MKGERETNTVYFFDLFIQSKYWRTWRHLIRFLKSFTMKQSVSVIYLVLNTQSLSHHFVWTFHVEVIAKLNCTTLLGRLRIKHRFFFKLILIFLGRNQGTANLIFCFLRNVVRSSCIIIFEKLMPSRRFFPRHLRTEADF